MGDNVFFSDCSTRRDTALDPAECPTVCQQLQKSRLENEYLKQDQLKAQLFSLQQQISPHFLFNSLSTLRTIAPDPMTKTYVMQLANVYRYLLTVHDS